MAKVLVADDDDDIRLMLRTVLFQRGLEVEEAPDGTQALERAREGSYDILVLDQSMPGLTGVEVAREARAWFEGPIVFYSAYLTGELKTEIRESVGGNVHVVAKTDLKGFLDLMTELAA